MRAWRRPGVQARSAMAATATLAIVVVLASVALVILLQRALIQNIDTSERARAEGIAAQVGPGTLNSVQAAQTSGDLLSAISAGAAARSVIQVLGPDGTVLASSADIKGAGAMTRVEPGMPRISYVDRQLPIDDDDHYRVLVLRDSTGGVPFTVLVGQSLGPVEDSTQIVVSLLAVGGPLLLIAVGFATFWFVGRSLRPIEEIRRTVAGIGDRDLSDRVPVPAADDEVARLAETMNAMLARLELAQVTQRQFVADASHELRSPIATLRAGAEIRLAHPESIDAADFLTAVLTESQRLERLVSGLLLLARADERGLNPDVRDVDLDHVLDLERQRVQATTGLDVRASISAARVRGDRHQLAQAVRNLVDNAAAHAHSRVDLATYRQNGEAVLEVFNDGEAIAPADRERIFGRFVRLEESRDRSTGGSGLGLAIVREIVRAHEGTVSVLDAPGGARFQMRLPAADDVGHPPSAASR